MTGFDVELFRNTEFSTRQEEVTLPALDHFGGGVFLVKGLTAEELAIADEASSRTAVLTEVVQKILSSSNKTKSKALVEGMGFSTETPEVLQKRMQHVRLGVVEPKLEDYDVAKLADTFPVEFSQLANKVLELTGKGQVASLKRQGSSIEPT